MKKTFILWFLALFAFASCERGEVENLFDATPEERMSAKLQELEDILTGANNGWKAYLTTNLSGGYGFYMDFKDDNSLVMLSDINNSSASTVRESTYRIKWQMDASLIFDTYNYIALLQDPGVKVPNAGGTPANGLQSDIEFQYDRSSADSVFLKGKRYKNELVLVRATSAEKSAFLNGEYETMMQKSRDFFVDNQNPYFMIGSEQVAISIDHNRKNFNATFLVDGQPTGVTRKSFYSIDGIGLTSPLEILGGISIARLEFEGDDLYVIDTNGQKYLVQNSVMPFLSLYDMLGVRYTGLRLNYRTVYPGTSPAGRVIVERYVENLHHSSVNGYTFQDGTLTLIWSKNNKTITMNGWHRQSGAAGWTTAYVYDYNATGTDNVHDLTHRSGPLGGYVGNSMNLIDSFMRNHEFKLDYHVDGTELYGKITSVTDPDVIMTFQLVTP